LPAIAPGKLQVLIANTSQANSSPETQQDSASGGHQLEIQDTDQPVAGVVPSLSLYGLSDDQALMLEQAIANAASAAQAQAEAEAALEEEDDYEEGALDNDIDNGMGNQDP
jgi:hypothetical protein